MSSDAMRRHSFVIEPPEGVSVDSLVRAAPELYEALSQLLASCTSIPVGGGDGNTFAVGAPSSQSLRIAERALAKARGAS